MYITIERNEILL